jgi:hypothetical protein
LRSCRYPQAIAKPEHSHNQPERGPADDTLRAKVKNPIHLTPDDPMNAAAQKGVCTAPKGAKEGCHHKECRDFARPEDKPVSHLFRL